MAKKILVVDDDPVGGRLTEARLAAAGYEVFRAMNGEEALHQLPLVRPDLIVLDIEMPEMNGYTFVMEMKKLEDFKATPVIVLTAHSENRAIFARRGISHYLVKPVDFDVLFAKMKELSV